MSQVKKGAKTGKILNNKCFKYQLIQVNIYFSCQSKASFTKSNSWTNNENYNTSGNGKCCSAIGYYAWSKRNKHC